jgi:hypothetical protein
VESHNLSLPPILPRDETRRKQFMVVFTKYHEHDALRWRNFEIQRNSIMIRRSCYVSTATVSWIDICVSVVGTLVCYVKLNRTKFRELNRFQGAGIAQSV